MLSRFSRRLHLLLLPAVALTALAATGCIRSRVEITSEPSQAEVIWHGEPRGVTPITIPFIWYWHHDIVIEKPGYERLEVVERFRTPPWFLMPLDLFMEILPIPIPDHRTRHYVLTPETSHEQEPQVQEISPEMLLPNIP